MTAFAVARQAPVNVPGSAGLLVDGGPPGVFGAVGEDEPQASGIVLATVSAITLMVRRRPDHLVVRLMTRRHFSLQRNRQETIAIVAQ